MRRRSPWRGVVLALGLVTSALPARAEGTTNALTSAKRAYADVDYEKTRELAADAIRRGGNDRVTTTELYWLWGTAAAALDQPEEAVGAFLHALASNPARKLDRGLSPKIRAPYLEARGKLGALGGRGPLEVALQRRQERLEITLHDALEVASGLELGTRELGASSFAQRKLPAAPVHELPSPRSPELWFFVRVLDRYGNVLLELGSPSEPHRLVLAHAAERPAPAAAALSRDRSPTTHYVVSGALATLGLAAGGFAAAMYVRREDAARSWNSEACERPGSTRAQQCAGVDDRRERAEALAIGLTAASGALLIGSAVSLLLAPRARPTSGVGLSVGPSELALSWKTEL